MRYGKQKRLESSDYAEINMTSGSFGYVRAMTVGRNLFVSDWETCRDEFHDRLRSFPPWIALFCHQHNRSYAVASFMDRVERLAGVKPQSLVGPTQFSRISYVRISKWWLEDDMRMSLLTLMLRAGRNYDGDLEAALRSQRYLRQTMPAVRRFLRGCTKYTGTVTSGWNDQFFHDGKKRGKAVPPDERRIRRLLVRPTSRARGSSSRATRTSPPRPTQVTP